MGSDRRRVGFRSGMAFGMHWRAYNTDIGQANGLSDLGRREDDGVDVW